MSVSIGREIRKGAFWVLLFSTLAGPIGLLRNWLMTIYDPSGEYVTSYALLMVVYNLITTLLIFGGSSVLTKFIPTIDDAGSRQQLLYNYTAISICLIAIMLIYLSIFPDSLSTITGGRLGASNLPIFLCLSLPVVISQILIFYIQGNKDYRLSASMNQMLNLVNTFAIIALILFNIDEEAIKINQSFFLFIAAIFVFSSIMITTIVVSRIFKESKFSFSIGNFPSGFWSFSINVHALTLLTFSFNNLDQLYVLNAIGSANLGTYFLIIQLVEVVRFLPVKLGQVLLASFSEIVHSGNEALFKRTYQVTSRYLGLAYLILSAALICIGKIALNIYGISNPEGYWALVILVVGFNIACIGNMNSMVLLSLGLSRQFLFNNVLVVATMLVGFHIFASFNFLGVFMAKVLAIVVGQIGLFRLISRSQGFSLINWREYLVSQLMLMSLVILQMIFDIDKWWENAIVFLAFVCLVWLQFGLSRHEIHSIVKKSKDA